MRNYYWKICKTQAKLARNRCDLKSKNSYKGTPKREGNTAASTSTYLVIDYNITQNDGVFHNEYKIIADGDRNSVPAAKAIRKKY